MTSEDPTLPAEIESISLTVRVDCTVSVNNTDWVKPGASATTKWKGVPSAEQFQLAKEFMQTHMLAPTINEALALAVERIEEHVKEVRSKTA